MIEVDSGNWCTTPFRKSCFPSGLAAWLAHDRPSWRGRSAGTTTRSPARSPERTSAPSRPTPELDDVAAERAPSWTAVTSS
ncbi:MAG: hypothetical protein U0790_05320 [Isosphaeraceae bacterium]